MVRYIIVIAVLVLVLVLVYIRFAPFDAAKFHKAAIPADVGDYPGLNSFVAIREITAPPEDVMKILDGLILKTLRSKRIAGQLGDDVITYETRSLLFGYPDYTSVSIIGPGSVGNAGPLLALNGRARFGMSDVGVNRKRIESWLDALGPLTVAP